MNATPSFEDRVNQRAAEMLAEQRRQLTASEMSARAAFATLALERAAEAQTEATRAALEQRLTSRHQVKGRRDLAREGTPPGEVWGERDAALCEEFIDYVRERDFAAASTLKHSTMSQRWTLKAYGVGGVAFGMRRFTDPDDPMDKKRQSQRYVRCTDRAFNIYLGANGALWFHFNKDDPHHPTRKNTSKEPTRLSSLPLDGEGRVMVPVVGHFATWADDGRARQLHSVRPYTRDDRGAITTIPTEPHTQYKGWRGDFAFQDYFVQQDLATVLLNHAAQAQIELARNANT